MTPRVRISTFGCKVNQCDSEEIARSLAALGWEVVPCGPAAVHIVNTCTVTATADTKARKLIRKLAREQPAAAIIVTGCWAQRDPESARALPGVRAVLGNEEKARVPEVLSRMLARGRRLAPAQHAAPLPSLRRRAFVKIQDGCDHRCAYCAVPDARGRPTSRPMAEVLAEVERLLDAGAQEIVLCGIRLGAYGRERQQGPGLAALLHEMRALPVPRLRLSSIEPMDLGEELLEEVADHPRLCHHLHLPLESGDDGVLGEMGRGYTRADFARLVRRAREGWPDVALTSDVMVGFPGESEEQFQRTAAFVQEMRFSRLHVFPYSRRPGTPAAQRRNQVPVAVTRERAERLRAVGAELAQRAAADWVGREVSVLFEEQGRDGRLTGLTEHYLRLRCPGPRGWIGRIISVAAERAVGGELRTRHAPGPAG